MSSFLKKGWLSPCKGLKETIYHEHDNIYHEQHACVYMCFLCYVGQTEGERGIHLLIRYQDWDKYKVGFCVIRNVN